MEVLFFLVINIAIAYSIGCLGKKYKIGFGWAFAFSIFLHPIIAIIIVLCSGKKSTTFIEIKKEDNENNR